MSYTKDEVIDIYQEMFNQLGCAPSEEHYAARFSEDEMEQMIEAMGIKRRFSDKLSAAINIAVLRELRVRNGGSDLIGTTDWHKDMYNSNPVDKKLIISDSELEAKLKRELEDSKSKAALEEEFAKEAKELEELEESEEPDEQNDEVEWWK